MTKSRIALLAVPLLGAAILLSVRDRADAQQVPLPRVVCGATTCNEVATFSFNSAMTTLSCSGSTATITPFAQGANAFDASFGGNTSTSDATQTNCGTYTIPTDTTAGIKCQIVGFKSDEAQGAYYERSIGARNASGTVSQIGATAAVVTVEDNAAWDVTMDVSGTTARVRVTGEVDGATTISWRAKCQVTYGPQ